MSRDLFAAARDKQAAARNSAPLIESSRPALVAYVTDGHACHDCPFWLRRGRAIGVCDAEASPHRGGLTSYAAICCTHPFHPSRHPSRQQGES